jgi:hypothetical protein
MSVRIRPSIRCSFDEDQGVLRLAHMEKAEEGDGQQLVIYALKVRPPPTASMSLHV